MPVCGSIRNVSLLTGKEWVLPCLYKGTSYAIFVPIQILLVPRTQKKKVGIGLFIVHEL